MSQWVRNAFTIAGLAVGRYVRSFMQILILTFSVIALILILGLIFKSPALLGIGFALAILAVLAVWLPIGIVRKVFIKGADTFSGGIRAIAGWLAFMGFVGILYPNFLANFYLVLGLFFLGFIFWGFSKKETDTMRRLAVILTIIMVLIVAVNYASPGFSRYINSKTKQMEKFFNVRSTENEFQATETYVQANKLAHLYSFTFDDEGVVTSANVTKVLLPKDSLALLMGLKNENIEYEEQSFIQIKLKDPATGVYLTGKKYYVLAGDVDILGHKEPKKVDAADSSIPVTSDSTVMPITTGLAGGTYGPGTYYFWLDEDQATGRLVINGKHVSVHGDLGDYNQIFVDGSGVELKPGDDKVRTMEEIIFKVVSHSEERQKFTMKVWN
jgi:hypothetical protein